MIRRRKKTVNVTKRRIKINNNVPVAIKIINGSVPDYYSDGKLNSSSNILSLPIETD